MRKQDHIKSLFTALQRAAITGIVPIIGNSLIAAFLFTACSSDEWQADNDRVLLSPQIQVGESTTRSVISGTAANPDGNGNLINQVQLYITRDKDDHTVYPGLSESKGLATFTLGASNDWTSDPKVSLSSDMARIFAFYPPIAAGDVSTNFIASSSDEKHKIKVSIPSNQTFDGATAWGCSTTDYLYGSSSSTKGDTKPITANNGNGDATGPKPFSPEISMQHALSLLVFYLESKSGRDVDNTYDYVKEIRLSTTDATHTFRISGSADDQCTMFINDGTLALTTSSLLKFKATTAATGGTATTAQLCGKAGSPALVAYGLVAPLTAAPSDLTLTVVLDKKDETTDMKRELSLTFGTSGNTPKAWKKGNRYKYNLTLTDRDIAIKSTSITEWPDGWSGSSNDKGDGSLKPDGF